ncbi:MAG: hypothetical protein Q4B70_00875 [Lachnospiraceae bacterium]|nr:hypothetical protein [Lachnospiraceae bacterium]
MENKQRICSRLLTVLQATRDLEDIIALIYFDEQEVVCAYFANGGVKRINVCADSGIAMVKDILKQIV